jgi:hypothetical protein
MGTNFFHKGSAAGAPPSAAKPSSLNMMARSESTPVFAGAKAGGQSRKDLGAAAGFVKLAGPLAKTAASNAKGPRI